MVEMIVEEFFWRGVSDAMKQGTKALIAPIHQSVTIARIKDTLLQIALGPRKTRE